VGNLPVGSSPLSNLVTGGLDIWSLLTGQDKSLANQAMQIAAPMLPLQGQALSQAGQFLTDPSSFLKDPAFQAAEQIGAENISRQAGAAGMASSGNRLADLFKYGTSMGLGFEQQKWQQLMDVLKGSPDAAKLLLGGQAAKQGTIGDLITRLLGGGGVSGLLGQLGGLFSGGGSDLFNAPVDWSSLGGGDFFSTPSAGDIFTGNVLGGGADQTLPGIIGDITGGGGGIPDLSNIIKDVIGGLG